jgi:hypothetical protein
MAALFITSRVAALERIRPKFYMFGLVFQFSVSPVCESCKASPATAALFITSRVAALERALQVSLIASVADPDPYVFGPRGSGSITLLYHNLLTTTSSNTTVL